MKGYGKRGVDFDQQLVNKPTAKIRHAQSPNLMIANRLLPDLIDDPEFRLVQIQTADANGAIKVGIAYTPSNTKNNPPYTGHVTLDPAKQWSIKSYEIILKYPDGQALYLVEFETKKLSSGYHVATQQVRVRKILQAPTPFEMEYRVEYDIREDDEPPDEVFTLSHYGLPEPVGMTRRDSASHLTYWILGGAVGFGGLALAFRYLARSKRPKVE